MTSGTWPAGWSTGDVTLASEYRKGIGALFDTTLGASAASVDISSIVGTYAHLMVAVYARGDAAAATTIVGLRFNGDGASNFDFQALQGSAASVTSSETFTTTLMQVGIMPANTAGANLFNAGLIFIPHYAGSSNNKVALSLSSSKSGVASGNMATTLTGGFWRSNAAINRITLIPNVGNFVAGTRVTIFAMGA